MKKERMSKITYLLFLVIALAVNAYGANAYFYNITYSCKDGVCVKGELATWYITISNNGKSEIEYVAIELLPFGNASPFAYFKIPFYPLSDRRGNLIVVKPDENVTVNLTGQLPKSNYGNLLIYQPCFTTTITDSYIIAQTSQYETRKCYNQNETMEIVECASDSNCNSDYLCRFNKCEKLNCKSCQYIKEHKCVSYECCSPEQCRFNQFCKNNTCASLNCGANEYQFNHSCNFLNCAFDEFIDNRTCKKLNCSYEEFAFNHSCKRLNCTVNEFIYNQTCKLLNCKESEYANNHVCIPLICLENETVYNHACKPLNCYFFQDTENHFCTNNKSILFKSLMELLAVIIIIMFFILDFTKYKKIKK